MERFGLLAGWGRLPLEVAKGIKKLGQDPVIVGLQEEVEPFLEEAGFSLVKMSLGALGRILEYFQDCGVNTLVMAGKVQKGALFTGPKLDENLQNLLLRLRIKNDDAILQAVVDYFERHGIRVETQTRFLGHLLPKPGLLTKCPPTTSEMQDIRFGFSLAKEMGRLDIGQSVVVKDGVILAVEAIEGTDQAILRGGELGGEGTVVVKVAKPHQDLRFDVPTVGLNTLNSLVQSRARVLAIEAGATFFLNKEEFIVEAERIGLSVIAVDQDSGIDK
ncbi:MAG TPA: LpxI family protein [Firmicutes bacterium]|nr:LpxI family protein [Bacillota bacterium]